MNSNHSQTPRRRSRLYAFVIGVPIISLLYTGCLLHRIDLGASHWHGQPFDLLFTIFYIPCYWLSAPLPRAAAEWLHGFWIIPIVGALWGIVIVGLGFGVIEAVRKRSRPTQGAAPHGGSAPQPSHSEAPEGSPPAS